MSNALTIQQKQQEFHRQFEKMDSQFEAALPAHISKERFSRIAMTAIKSNKALLDAKRDSLFAAVLEAAQLGLVTDKWAGEAYLIPYKGDVQMQVGYQGLMKLARQSGEISTIYANCVYEGDKFDVDYGENTLLHKPDLEGKNEDKDIKFVYAIAKLKDGEKQMAILKRSEIEKIRSSAPSANSPAWKNWYSEMAKKCAIKRLCKLLPKSTDTLVTAMAYDDKQEYGDQGMRDITPQEGGAVNSINKKLADSRKETFDIKALLAEMKEAYQKEAYNEVLDLQHENEKNLVTIDSNDETLIEIAEICDMAGNKLEEKETVQDE